MIKKDRADKIVNINALNIRTVERAIRHHWSVEKLIININSDFDIYGGFLSISDEELLLRSFCSGIVG